MTVFLKVLNHLLANTKDSPTMVDSDTTMDIAKGVFEDLSYFHQLHPEVVRNLENDAQVEIFIDSLVAEVSLWAEHEAFPPVGSRVLRIFMDGGALACDIEVR